MTATPQFLFATCQIGAENALKSEIAVQHPELRSAFARPGFVTFKFVGDASAGPGFRLRSTFARAWGATVGKVDAAALGRETACRAVWELLESIPVTRLHVWPRAGVLPGTEDCDLPWPDEVAVLRKDLLAAFACVGDKTGAKASLAETDVANVGEWVADCILVEPQLWWVGYHRAEAFHEGFPGGRPPLCLPPHAVSRAWLKMEEALRWSQPPCPAGTVWAELGSAPGGAAQALLERGFHVLGVDPAEMHPDVLAHPNFTHLRQRTNQASRKEFRKVRWLAADLNVAPNYTLRAVESLVKHGQLKIKGLLLTLKLVDWALADRLPECLARVRSWGYNPVRARQLWHNRQELCIAAIRDGGLRRDVRSPRRAPA
ncbi:SAM-dependent methyltransferase [Thermopirellula anaerolimosa]